MTSERAAPPPSSSAAADTAPSSTSLSGAGAASDFAAGSDASASGVAPPLPPTVLSLGHHWVQWLVGGVAVVGLTASIMLWQRLQVIQEQLARQTADATTQAVEARTMANHSQEQVLDATSRLSVAEARLAELSAQRLQFDELMQSVSRSRDENLLVDLDSMLRTAQQHAQFTGSLEPLVAALRSAGQRIDRTGQIRLGPVRRAIDRDLQRLSGAQVTDTAGLLMRIDELVRQIDELPLKNAVGSGSLPPELPSRHVPADDATAADNSSESTPPAWWRDQSRRIGSAVYREVRGLVRVSRIDQPDAVLLEPSQAFFLRENLKLKLLNARLGVLSRQFAHARADLNAAQVALEKYFDERSRRTQMAVGMLHQAQTHLRSGELPRMDETLGALSAAATQP